MLNETVRLDSLHFSAIGGDLDADNMREWTQSLGGGSAADDSLVRVELTELSNLVADSAKR